MIAKNLDNWQTVLRQQAGGTACLQFQRKGNQWKISCGSRMLFSSSASPLVPTLLFLVLLSELVSASSIIPFTSYYTLPYLLSFDNSSSTLSHVFLYHSDSQHLLSISKDSKACLLSITVHLTTDTAQELFK